MKDAISSIALLLCLCLILLIHISCDEGTKECECVCDCESDEEDVDDDDDDDDGHDDDLDPLMCDPQGGVFSTTITNPYTAFVIGNQWILEGMENFEEIRERITVLDQTETVAGVTTRSVETRKWFENELIEISWRYFAQTADGTVCYFGKDVDEYRFGSITGHEGAWRAGDGGAQAGILMPGTPEVGMTFNHFNAPGIGNENAEITAMDGTYTTPGGSFNEVLTMKVSTMEGGQLERKYAYDVGLIVDQAKELTE